MVSTWQLIAGPVFRLQVWLVTTRVLAVVLHALA